jgi:hypothetical protein
MSDFAAYLHAQTRTEKAYAEYNSAARALEIAQIRQRLAEIKSQHEPLASLVIAKLSERDRLHAAAFYVVVGRMPDGVAP